MVIAVPYWVSVSYEDIFSPAIVAQNGEFSKYCIYLFIKVYVYDEEWYVFLAIRPWH